MFDGSIFEADRSLRLKVIETNYLIASFVAGS